MEFFNFLKYRSLIIPWKKLLKPIQRPHNQAGKIVETFSMKTETHVCCSTLARIVRKGSSATSGEGGFVAPSFVTYLGSLSYLHGTCDPRGRRNDSVRVASTYNIITSDRAIMLYLGSREKSAHRAICTLGVVKVPAFVFI